jgi:hypothetical protein
VAERALGDPNAIHFGLKSTVSRAGYPAGYLLALGYAVVMSLFRLGSDKGLETLSSLHANSGAYQQPTEWSPDDAASLAQELRGLSQFTLDPTLLDAAGRLAAVAEACASSAEPSERLLIRFT